MNLVYNYTILFKSLTTGTQVLQYQTFYLTFSFHGVGIWKVKLFGFQPVIFYSSTWGLYKLYYLSVNNI